MSDAPLTDLGPAGPRCACGSLRRTTRAIARFYDSQLSEANLTVTQFSILRRSGRSGRVPLNWLAEDLAMERTSLYRAIGPLKRRGLVRTLPAADRRQKELKLTAEGRRTWRHAETIWQETQRKFVKAYGAERWNRLAGLLDSVHPALEEVTPN
jgi:DNA-binding MarR family transcriptional regulator